jgi:putative ABC transport system permease protein
MSFLGLVLKNLLRQRVRAALTLAGISIGITTVVALGVITGGFKTTVAELLLFGDSDLMVAQEGSSDLTFSTVSEDDWRRVDAYPGVGRTIPALFNITRVGSNPYFYMLGLRAEDLILVDPPLAAGRVLEPRAGNEIMLGDRGSADLGKTVGDEVEVGGVTFLVVGIYHTGRVFEDNGAYAPLATVQQIVAKPATLSVVYVKAADGTDPGGLKASLRRDFPNLVAISEVSEVGEVDQGIELLDAANLGISVLAVGLGALGVMNTMVMAVFERTREIGILRAVGWSGWRVVRMVVMESFALCLLASVIGSLLGVVATEAILRIPAVAGLLEPSYSSGIFVRGLVVGVIVALVGAAYPAFRAVRLTPMEALRYE